MRRIALLVFSLFILVAQCFAGNLAKNPASSMLDMGWEVLYSDNSSVVAMNSGKSHIVVSVKYSEWDNKYNSNSWHHDPAKRGSAYYDQMSNRGVYVFNVKGVVAYDYTLNSALKFATSESYYSFKTSERLKTVVHSSEKQCALGRSPSSLRPMGLDYPFLNRLQRCGGNAVTNMIQDIVTLVKDPLTFITSKWDTVKFLYELVTNFNDFKNAAFRQFSQMSEEQIFDAVCPVVVEMVIGYLTGRFAVDKIMSVLKSASVYQRVSDSARALGKGAKAAIGAYAIASKIDKFPGMKTLTMGLGRVAEGTAEAQQSMLAIIREGQLLLNGKALDLTTDYSGVILRDGRMLLGNRTKDVLHIDLITGSDEVVTAFELKGMVRRFVITNQSGTFEPDYDDFRKALSTWTKLQKADDSFWNKGFKFMIYKPLD